MEFWKTTKGKNTHSKNIYNQLFINYMHLILMPKVDIYALDQECVQNSNITLGIGVCQSIRNKGTSLALEP
jgi:hypothetical protein